MPKTAITPTRDQDFAQWYQQVIQKADLAETSPVRGCMVIKPWGYAIWERMQGLLDGRIKATGHQNIYCPLLIPKSYIEREAEHVSGFAKECAVVTHHRLEDDGQGGLQPAGALEEPYIIRPTSETMIGELFSKWVQSYRDLPLLVNQWANVMRWEMRTRLFLRTSEFLWQEGHTAHASEAEARDETLKMLGEYRQFAEQHMAMPVCVGEKTASERFPGAVDTYCIEAMMQDGKALQAGTSHFLGQNFSRSFGIDFASESGEQCHAWTTSWGMSTRMMGALIMTHGDDDGLVLPPALAPYQVVLMPLIKDASQRPAIMAACEQLASDLRAQQYGGEAVRVHIDAREMRGGEKAWHWVKKGVPIRIEMGQRELDAGQVTVSRRDQPYQQRVSMTPEACVSGLATLLTGIQDALWQQASQRLADQTHHFDDVLAFEQHCAQSRPGFVTAYYAEDDAVEQRMKSQFGMTVRCILASEDNATAPCLFHPDKQGRLAVFAKAY